jgi:hypothetical protein
MLTSPVIWPNQLRLNRYKLLNTNKLLLVREIMKFQKSLFPLQILLFAGILWSCNSNPETVTKTGCLSTQFPLEEEEGKVSVLFRDSKNRLQDLQFVFDGIEDNLGSRRVYDSKGNVVRVDLYVNTFLASEFFRITHSTDSIKEEFFNTSTAASNLLSYRKYYLTNGKVTSYAEYERTTNLELVDSVVFSYTVDNVTEIAFYGNDETIDSTITVEYDDKISPYYKSNFSGDLYLFSYLNLSKNNPTELTTQETGETVTYTYEYNSEDLPNKRTSSLATNPGVFTYNCTN